VALSILLRGISDSLAKRRRKVPKQVPPRLIEGEYAAILLGLVDRTEKALQPLLDAAPRLLARAADDLKHDQGEARTIAALAQRARDKVVLNTQNIESVAALVADKTSRYQSRQLSKQIEAGLGIDIQFLDRKIGGMIETFTAENVALIKDIPTKMIGDIERTITSGVTTGKLHGDIAEDLENRLGFGRDRARLIARDQVGKFYGNLNRTRQTEIGIKRYFWRTVHDERVRDEHDDRDGEIFEWDDPPEDGHPGQPIQCRCLPDPVLDDILDEVEDLPEEPEETVEPAEPVEPDIPPLVPEPAPVVEPLPEPAPAPVPTPVIVAPVVVGMVAGASSAVEIAAALGGLTEVGISAEAVVVRENFDAIMAKRGLHNSDAAFTPSVAVKWLDPGVQADHAIGSSNIRINPKVAKRASEFFEHSAAGTLFKGAEIGLASERINAVATIAHEVIHGHGPPLTHGFLYGGGLRVEEVVTEVLSRKVVREEIGIPGLPSLQTRAPGQAYQKQITSMLGSIQSITGDSVSESVTRLERAAEIFKKRSTSHTTIREHVGAFVDDLGIVGQQRMTMIEAIEAQGWP